ncbi:hypothetical protein AVEN_200928-1 [Araneus ventricosus]|uniref:Uncharacterized protein n=1 Tax=Araneus ventricosus TaxID=182803 RepID=A0A4Y2CZJ5_ARAVE|nr:hypothetical protein AVEN_2702-1 [Araneus ventricosus]GBM09604.1 hypothetical protein AVEN_200928-1 [Araneus ventricosus]
MNIIEDIQDALLHAVEKRSPPPRTPTDLLTALQDSWCEKPPGCLQTLVESIPHRVAALLCVLGALHVIRQSVAILKIPIDLTLSTEVDVPGGKPTLPQINKIEISSIASSLAKLLYDRFYIEN